LRREEEKEEEGYDERKEDVILNNRIKIIVTCRTVARERLGKHILAATNTQATIG
jgi:hypothetical protein